MQPSSEIFRESAAVYDLIYGGKDTVAEVAWIVSVLESHGCNQGANLLEFGSGTGRHARILADRGYRVTGVEPSVDMLAQAEPHPHVAFLRGDTKSINLSKKFDAVLGLFHVMSYHTELADLYGFFETASRHLEAGGLFAFDVWYTPAVHAVVPNRRTLEKANSSVAVSRTAQPLEDIPRSLVTVTYDYEVTNLASGEKTKFSESHEMRHFTQTEIELLARGHGFDLLESCEFMSGRTPSRETWGVWFSLRKI